MLAPETGSLYAVGRFVLTILSFFCGASVNGNTSSLVMWLLSPPPPISSAFVN
jgi:hypothetical protein